MSWIREADVAVPSVISCMSINPDLMAAVQNLNAKATFGSSALTRTQERPSPRSSPWSTAAAIEPSPTEGSSVNTAATPSTPATSSTTTPGPTSTPKPALSSTTPSSSP